MTNSKRGGRSTAGRPEGGKGGDSSDRRNGEKGAGKGKFEGQKGASKGNGKGKKGEAKNASSFGMPQERHVAGAKTVQELEAEMLLSKVGAGTTKERREALKHPLEAKGAYCEVKKHSDMGCAVVSFKEIASRDAVMKLAQAKAPKTPDGDDDRPSLKVSGVDVQLRPHIDKAAQEEVKNDIFVAWGRKTEKDAQLPAQTIAEAIDLLVIESRGGHLGAEHSNHGSPLLGPPLSPMNGHGNAPMQGMPPMQLPQPLTQLLPPMVPGPQSQQQQVDAYQFMQYAWAAQQQQALQQQQQQQQAAAQQQQAYSRQMQPPSSPQHAAQTSPSLGVLETPPRPAGTPGKMRAGAAEYTPSPVQQFGAYDQSQYVNELEQFANYDYNNMGAIQQPKKQFSIIDPTSGQSIPWETPKMPGFEPPQLPGRKPIKIVDPNSGKSVDTLGMIFTPAKAPEKKFSIIDPKSGGNIQM